MGNNTTAIMSEGDVKPSSGPVVAEAHQVDTFHPPKKMLDKHPSKPHLSGLGEYQTMYKESITEPDKFWGKLARELLTWQRDFQTVHSGTSPMEIMRGSWKVNSTPHSIA